MIWFTADTHLGHNQILRYCPLRQCYRNVDEMGDAFIENTNRYVDRHDILYDLGDFCWRASKAGKYRQAIKCKTLHVVRGNHDSSSLKNHVTSLNHMVFLKHPTQNCPNIHLCHYPLFTWSHYHYGGIHLYGHCHSTIEEQLDKINPERMSMDVGVDNIFKLFGEYRPISLEEVVEFLPRKPI